MKTIYVDISILLRSKYITGIQRVTIEVLKRLLQKYGEYDLVLLSERDGNSYYRVDKEQFSARYIHKQQEINQLLTPEYITVDDMARQKSVFFDIDSVWSCSNSRLQLYPKLKKRNIRIVTLVYDLIVITHPQYTSQENLLIFPRYITAVARYSDVVILNTQDAANNLKYFAKKGGIQRELDCRVIPLGADFAETRLNLDQVSKRARKIAGGKPYILMVSTIEPRKNHKVLLDAFDQKLEEMGIQLVFVGRRGWNVDALMERIQKHPQNGIMLHHLEGENDETVRFLYQNAFMVFFPTYIEGYGLATIEAMQQHTPVALSDIPVMHEVGGDFCDYFDPDAPGEIIDIAKKYLNDPLTYQKKREMLDTYVPFTWDQMAESTSQVLLEESSEGLIEGEVTLRQMVMLTARSEDFLNTIPYIENRMGFIQEIVTFCPEWTKHEIMDAYRGRIDLKFVTDDELLAGKELPEDHGERNFFLRTLIMRHELVDDYFLMSDDDYRPLENISADFFVKDGKMNIFYFYDLDLWEKNVFMSTSFDRLQINTNKFLKENSYPNLQYASHMPQIICKRWFIDMLNKHSDPPIAGVCEWSSYCNYIAKEHPNSVNVRPYVTLTWPGRLTSWDMMVIPEKYYFENHYEQLYQENQIFEGYASLYASNANVASKRVVADWTSNVAKHSKSIQAQEEFCQNYLAGHGATPDILFSIDENGVRICAPAEINCRMGSIFRFKISMMNDVEKYIHDRGLNLVFGWSFRNSEILRTTGADMTGKYLLTIVMPKNVDLEANAAEYEVLRLYCSVDGGSFECIKEIALQIKD